MMSSLLAQGVTPVPFNVMQSIEVLGPIGAFIALVTVVVVVLYKFVFREALTRFVELTNNIRDTMNASAKAAEANRDGASIIAGAQKVQESHLKRFEELTQRLEDAVEETKIHGEGRARRG